VTRRPPDYAARVRDTVSARYLIFEVMEVFQEALAARGSELEDLVGDSDSARRFVDAMPSADVCVSLKTAAHRNPQTRWTANIPPPSIQVRGAG
jgi:hypothetical protein